jgi:hypothetical protein
LPSHLRDNREGAVYIGFSASANDVLAFTPNLALNRQFTWYSREGNIIETVGEPGLYGMLALSPDGTRLPVEKGNG